MRVSRIQAAENRQTVINSASRLFRERGFDGIGIKDVMENAGLTQGGFYKQFDSKQDLAAEASKRAFENAAGSFSAALAANPKNPLDAALAYYLSMEHRDDRLGGCPIVGLGSEAARQSNEVRATFETGIKALLEELSGLIAAAGNKKPDAQALAVLSTMVGAVTLARIANDPHLARDILKAAGNHVRATVAQGSKTHRPQRGRKRAASSDNARPAEPGKRRHR